MKAVIYCIWQCTWGILQSASGLLIFLLHIRNKHYFYHGSVVTEWKNKSSVSLGMFVFVTDAPGFSKELKHEYTEGELSQRLLVHEYGHTIQSLILGPAYLIIIGIPSALWAALPYFKNKRKKERLAYTSFFTEKWADHLGERVTGQKSMENLVID